MDITLNVILCNDEEFDERSIEVSPTDKVEAIRDILHLEKEKKVAKFYKQFEEVESNDIIGEVFEEFDTVNVFIEPLEGTRGARYRNITNDSKDEIVLVVPSFKSKKPIVVPNNQIQNIKLGFLNWSNKMELYRKDKTDFGGHNIYTGKKYDLPKDDSILEFFIDDDGLKKLEMHAKELTPVNPWDDTPIAKYEREFYEPFGKELPMRFENTGEVPLYVVTGKKHNFDVSPIINGGTGANINIKQSRKGKFEFGVYSEDSKEHGTEVRANMFNAREVGGGKKIHVWREINGEFKASIVLCHNKEQLLKSTRTEHYRDKDRITLKDMLGWVLGAVGSIGGAAF